MQVVNKLPLPGEQVSKTIKINNLLHCGNYLGHRSTTTNRLVRWTNKVSNPLQLPTYDRIKCIEEDLCLYWSPYVCGWSSSLIVPASVYGAAAGKFVNFYVLTLSSLSLKY
jgi:hypothetical protein